MTTSQTTTCPACGAAATGNFCNACGASLVSRTCAGCQTPLSPEARFCHRCGLAAGAAKRASDRTAWLVAGALCLGLVGAIVYKVTGGAGQAAAPNMANVGSATGPAAATPTGQGNPPDISQMTPRERFDKLFNRIMQASEQGNRAEVEQFTPMALGAYTQLDVVDADARYHAAVLHLQADDAPAALALADTLLAASPGHLFGYIIRGTAAKLRKDTATERQAQQDFLARYQAEIQANRVEYADHRPVVDDFKRDAETGSR